MVVQHGQPTDAAVVEERDEEADRVLAVVAGMNALDALTALAAARQAGRRTSVAAIASSLAYGAAALAIRSMKD